MKTVKLMLVALTFIGTILTAEAQRTVVRVYPKHGTVVTTVKKPRVVAHKKTNFYFSDGIWYKAKGRNYVVCAAPVGIKVRSLPKGKKVARVNGRTLYQYKGIWYKKSGRHFVVVNV